jgi:hypothetical protein
MHKELASAVISPKSRNQSSNSKDVYFENKLKDSATKALNKSDYI